MCSMAERTKNPDGSEYWKSANKLVIFVPYNELDGDNWVGDGITVTVDIPSLLRNILPVNCLKDNACCASRYGQAPLIEPAKVEKGKELDQYRWEDDTLICNAGLF